MAKKTEQDKKSIEEQVILLRIESETIAKEITSKNAKLKKIVQEIANTQKEIEKEKEILEEEKKKLEDRKIQVTTSEANLRDKVNETEVVLKKLQREIKEETKRLTLTNEWVLEARNEGENLKQDNGVLALEIERRTNILSDINSLAQAKEILSAEVLRTQQSLAEITKNCSDVRYFTQKQIEQDNVKLAVLKAEILRNTTALHERLNERKRIENDISIYISRARAVYKMSFPELEMKL